MKAAVPQAVAMLWLILGKDLSQGASVAGPEKLCQAFRVSTTNLKKIRSNVTIHSGHLDQEKKSHRSNATTLREVLKEALFIL